MLYRHQTYAVSESFQKSAVQDVGSVMLRQNLIGQHNTEGTLRYVLFSRLKTKEEVLNSFIGNISKTVTQKLHRTSE